MGAPLSGASVIMTCARAFRVAIALLAVAAVLGPEPPLAAQPQDAEPLARIEQILVDGRKKEAPSTTEVKVIRGTSLIAATPSLSLFADDEVITGVNVAMTVLILDAAAEQDNTVHIGPASQFRLRGRRSIFLILGRLLADVRGLFDVVTSRATLGAKSTEFEVRVTETETQVVVLEGEVAVTDAATGGGAPGVPVAYAAGRGLPLIANARRSSWPLDLSPQQPVQHQRWTVEVNASAPVRTKQTLAITNRCEQNHLFDIESPASLPWFNLFLAERVLVPGGARRDVTVEIQVDPTKVAADTYSGDAAVRCLDCFSEPGCTQSRDPLPVQIRIARSSELSVRALEELTIGAGTTPAAPRKATEERVRNTVNWSSDVMVAGQPTYSARRVIPRFETPEQRARAFREARFSAFWAGDAASFERLGDVYSDWGEGPKALEAFTLGSAAAGARTSAPDFLAKTAEANRLTGRLDVAEEQLRQALATDPRHAVALNGMGNLQMDRAEVALDAGDGTAGQGLLLRARQSYAQSRESLAPAARDAAAVTRANEGDVHVQLGNLALSDQRFDVARREYETADATFRGAHEISPRYAFSRTGWGDAFQGLALVDAARGDTAAAREHLAQADAQYRAGLQANPDLAENYIGVGDVLLRQGRAQEAVQSYARAATVKPDDPAAYYRLGTALEKDSPVLAARYLSTYLHLRPAPFKNGRTARRASDTLNAIRKSPGAIKVPDVVGKTERDARETLTRSNLTVGTVTVRRGPGAAGTIVEQQPAAESTARAGAVVNLVVAAPPPGDTRPASVPDVTAMTLENAQRTLEAAGFVVGRVERKNSTRPAGTVLKQDPGARRTARPGTTVNLEVAQREIKPTRVPNLIGDTREHALDDLRDERLEVGRIIEQPGCTADRVVAQDPPKDMRVPEGTPVTLTISVPGPQAVRVPSVTGQPQSRAEGALRERGLRMGRVNRTETGRYEPGTVIAQEPRANVAIAPGCTVDLEVAIPVPLFAVPNFVGMTEEQARQRLPRGLAGILATFRLGDVTYRDYPSDNLRIARTAPRITAPTVIEQSPPANAQVPKGTEISVVVMRPPSRNEPPRVTVPRLEGMTLPEARKTLAGLNLVLGDVSYRPSTRRPTNRITAQNPAAGTPVPPGTRVSVAVDGGG